MFIFMLFQNIGNYLIRWLLWNFLAIIGLPGVLWVLPDSYLDVPNKDYGGEWMSLK